MRKNLGYMVSISLAFFSRENIPPKNSIICLDFDLLANVNFLKFEKLANSNF